MLLSLFRAEGADDRSVFGDFWFEPIGARSSTGLRVSGDAALRLTAVYACVRILAETMACLPLCIYRPRADGGRDVQKDHWLSRLMKKPNRWQDGFQWREMKQGHLTLRGNAYDRIIANGAGEITELRPLHPDRMSVQVLDDLTGRYRYSYKRADGTEEPIAPENVFHLRGLSSNGYTGLHPVELARESIGEGLAQQEYSSRLVANDGRPMGGWIEMPGTFRDTAAKTAWIESYQNGVGGVNRGKAAVFENGMKYHELGMKNVDQQFIEGRKLKITDIARIFRVPPHMIADLERSTNNNIEWQSLEFVKFTMLPWAERWEAALATQLLGDEQDVEVEFDFWALERGDTKTRGEFYNLGVQGGWLKRNEPRIREGFNPAPELEEFLQPANMVPAGTEPAEPNDPNDKKQPSDAEEQDGENEGTAARERALTLAIAARVVRKEVSACRKALCKGHTNVSFKAWLTEFYGEHVDYVIASLLCDTAIAAAWCDRQRAELEAALEMIGGSPSERLEALLDVWDEAAAAELAVRVQTSAR